MSWKRVAVGVASGFGVLSIFVGLGVFVELPPGNGTSSRTVAENLAIIHHGGLADHHLVSGFGRLVDSIAKNCPENTRQEIGDMSTKAWQVLQEKGIAMDLLSVMRGLNVATAGGVCKGNNTFTNITAAWLVYVERL